MHGRVVSTPHALPYSPAEVPFILVGTKSDLREDPKNSHLAVVSKEDGRVLAEELGAYEHMECSALTQDGLKEVFDRAIRVAMETRPAATTKPRRKCVIV